MVFFRISKSLKVAQQITIISRKYFKFYKSSLENSNKKLNVFEKQLTETRKKPKKITIEQLSPSITWQAVHSLPLQDKKLSTSKNCVILFPHFEDSEEVISKLSDFYNEYDLDVIIVRQKKSHFYLPNTGKSVISDLVSRLTGNNLPFNVHCFLIHSVASGVFFHAELTNILQSSYGSFNIKRIKGQIFDGLVLNDMKKALKKYRSSLPELFTVGKYQEAALDLINCPPPLDTLVFHSTDDVLTQQAEEILEKWRSDKKLNLSVSCWTRSFHGKNFLCHPIQYTKSLETFLLKTKFINFLK